jgi:predicted AlkP superfamily phosphohydrolase/phosphomutase
MAEPARTVFIGIDAGEPRLIQRWADEGVMPVLAGLRRSALWGGILNAPGIYTGSVWPSFHTGLEPGRHGRYFYRQLEPGTYRTAPFPADRLKAPAFWSRIGEAGRRIAVFDVPKAPLAQGLPGLQIADWGLHDPDGAPRSTPPALVREITARYGKDTVGSCDLTRRDGDSVLGLRDRLLERVERKTAIIRDLIARESWDLFATAFADCHCAGHQLWRLHDPSHPHHDALLVRAIGDPLRDVYAAVDAAIGRILDDLGSETTVIVLASHGMGPHYDATFLLDDILRRLEGLPVASDGGAMRKLRSLWHRMPAALRAKLAPVADSFYHAAQGRDRARRRCFLVPTNDNCAGIRINVAGREPCGIVRRGAEYDALCGKLESDLRAIVNVETGAPVVGQVLRSRDAFPGEHCDDLPDLLVRWTRDTRIRSVRSPGIGTLEREYRGSRSGDHRNAGMFFARGPGIAPGTRSQPVSITDFAPSLAALVGMELEDVDGHAIPELS